ncbi:DNA polymerase III subunit delta [Olsenella sp. HMSC062G07]|uniref:DNA polymerase III subunit delta n=1 Tax=Olsenella sp. HMSC062G07 TaxID=1739330 RepID=UPI0008A3D278|nr:DNA polymerase III subunit delta [Olsenella sp. HMSC062G07]OFK24638.1 DNA polymerase III subunit delta [Olsenella sp. HMSC062G07]
MASRSARPLLAAYLVVGEDELKSRAAQTRLKARLEPGLEAFNLDERQAGPDLDPVELVASLNTLPMGSGFRLVLIGESERLPKPVSEAIITYLADPNPGCVLLLVTKSLAKSTRLYKAVAALGPQAVIDCSAMRSRDLSTLVQKLATARGMSMGQDAARELVSRAGTSTTMLDNQVRALAALCGGRGEIMLADVERHVARTAEVKPWDFLDALCERRLPRALELYGLMQKPSQIALTALVAGRVRELICARSLADRGEANLLASTLRKPEWAVRRHVGWARRFGEGELERALASCASCERSLKGGGDAEIAFLSLMAAVCDL